MVKKLKSLGTRHIHGSVMDIQAKSLQFLRGQKQRVKCQSEENFCWSKETPFNIEKLKVKLQSPEKCHKATALTCA